MQFLAMLHSHNLMACFPARSKEGSADYANFILSIYENVTTVGLPNFIGTQIPVTTNLKISASAEIAVNTRRPQGGGFPYIWLSSRI